VSLTFFELKACKRCCIGDVDLTGEYATCMQCGDVDYDRPDQLVTRRIAVGLNAIEKRKTLSALTPS